MVPAEKSLLVCEAHLQAQLEGPAGNREALVHGCEDSGQGSGPTARFGKTRPVVGPQQVELRRDSGGTWKHLPA